MYNSFTLKMNSTLSEPDYSLSEKREYFFFPRLFNTQKECAKVYLKI